MPRSNTSLDTALRTQSKVRAIAANRMNNSANSNLADDYSPEASAERGSPGQEAVAVVLKASIVFPELVDATQSHSGIACHRTYL